MLLFSVSISDVDATALVEFISVLKSMTKLYDRLINETCNIFFFPVMLHWWYFCSTPKISLQNRIKSKQVSSRSR